jgi:hypothetical protein
VQPLNMKRNKTKRNKTNRTQTFVLLFFKGCSSHNSLHKSNTEYGTLVGNNVIDVIDKGN